MPLTFHEKMRNMLEPIGGNALGADNGDESVENAGCAVVFRRFVGGGLISRLMLVYPRGMTVVEVLGKCSDTVEWPARE